MEKTTYTNSAAEFGDEISIKSNIPEISITTDSPQNPTANWNFGQQQPIFSVKSLRLGFIRKVYIIFTIQLLLTAGLVALTNLQESMRAYINKHVVPFAGGPILLAIVILAIMLHNPKVTRRIPINFILLFIFTLMVGVATSALTTLTQAKYVLYSGAVLICPCIITTLYTLQNKFDLKWYGHFLMILVSVAMVSMVIYLLLPLEDRNLIWIAIISSFAVSMYVVIYIHCVIHSVCGKFRLENYVLSALSAYTVIIVVFLVALCALVAAKGEGCDGDCSGGSSNTFFCYGCYGYDARDRRRRESEEEEEEDDCNCC